MPNGMRAIQFFLFRCKVGQKDDETWARVYFAGYPIIKEQKMFFFLPLKVVEEERKAATAT